MGYVSDLNNHDARTEGLSYGMMIAVQLNKKGVFDRIWRWSKKYLLHQEGPREAYFAWSINPKTMKKNSEGSASDGEWMLQSHFRHQLPLFFGNGIPLLPGLLLCLETFSAVLQIGFVPFVKRAFRDAQLL